MRGALAIGLFVSTALFLIFAMGLDFVAAVNRTFSLTFFLLAFLIIICLIWIYIKHLRELNKTE